MSKETLDQPSQSESEEQGGEKVGENKGANLLLPQTPAVQSQVQAGGSSLTFLKVALGVVARLEADVLKKKEQLETALKEREDRDDSGVPRSPRQLNMSEGSGQATRSSGDGRQHVLEPGALTHSRSNFSAHSIGGAEQQSDGFVNKRMSWISNTSGNTSPTVILDRFPFKASANSLLRGGDRKTSRQPQTASDAECKRTPTVNIEGEKSPRSSRAEDQAQWAALAEEQGFLMDELRFLRDCLKAGHAQTQLPCALVQNEGATQELKDVHEKLRRTYTSAEGLAKVRKDVHLRGALRAVRELDFQSPQNYDPAKGVPWMGPPVPAFPSELKPDVANKVMKLYHESFNCWDFDIFNLAKLSEGRPLQFAGWEAMLRNRCFSEFSITPKKAELFLARCEALYACEERTPYHTNIHAADVTQSVHAMLEDVRLGAFFDPMDAFVAVLGGIIHDLGHDGRNNAFHVNTADTLALTYNDKSVLENHHLATAFRLLADEPAANILGDVLREQAGIIRRQIIEMVLGTDMSQHFSRVGEFGGLVTKLGPEPEAWMNDDTAMSVLRCTVLHLADISNPAKPFKFASQWSARLLQEFFAQGDVERDLGLPMSPMCDRKATDIAGSQIGFIDFIIYPSFESLSALVPRALSVCGKEIKRNKAAWESQKHDVELTLFTTKCIPNAAAKAGDQGKSKSVEVDLGAVLEEPPTPPPQSALLKPLHALRARKGAEDVGGSKFHSALRASKGVMGRVESSSPVLCPGVQGLDEGALPLSPKSVCPVSL